MKKRTPENCFTFVKRIVNTFWRRWNSNYFPSLTLRQIWHKSHRNVKIGDVVLIQDFNLVRGNWKLGKVSNVYPVTDGKVRRVDVQYKNQYIPRQRICHCSTPSSETRITYTDWWKLNELLSELSDTTYYNYCKPFFGEGVYRQQFVISIFFRCRRHRHRHDYSTWVTC